MGGAGDAELGAQAFLGGVSGPNPLRHQIIRRNHRGLLISRTFSVRMKSCSANSKITKNIRFVYFYCLTLLCLLMDVSILGVNKTTLLYFPCFKTNCKLHTYKLKNWSHLSVRTQILLFNCSNVTKLRKIKVMKSK